MRSAGASGCAHEHAGDAARLGDTNERAEIAGILYVDGREREPFGLLTDFSGRRWRPSRDGDDARWCFDRAHGVEDLIGGDNHVDASTLERVGQPAFFGV